MLFKSKDFSIGKAEHVIKGEIKKSLEDRVKKNLSFVTNIPNEYYPNIAEVIIENFGNLSILVPYLEKFDNLTKKEATDIAISQSIMAHSSLDSIRMQKAGMTKYEWRYDVHCQYNEHESLDKKIFLFSTPPIIDKSNKISGEPSSLPLCRCRIKAIISFDD